MQAREKDDRRDWIIVLLILLFGLLCILLAGGWALRLTPSWRLASNMESNLDPNSDFLTARSNGLIAPIDSSILTRPAWMDVYLTPGATFKTGTPFPTKIKNTLTLPPPATQTSTPVPTLVSTITRTPVIIYPTNTSVSKPPTRTVTPSATSLPTTTSADLSITITDGSTSYIVGGTLTYTIVVRNASGPNAVTGATVIDTFPASLSGITWTCTGAAGGSCPANGSGNINTAINLPVGASVTFTVNANVSPAATGNLVNTASVNTPATVSDPAPANNTATDTDTPIFNMNLGITKTDGSPTYAPGTSTTYTIVVTNAGPANATGATVADTFSATQITGVAWSCAAAGGATCPTVNGTGNINVTVNIPVGGTLTYTAVAAISPAATGNLLNTASVTAPVGAFDPTSGNNLASDTDTPIFNVDLRITKTDGVATYIPGTSTTYTIVVTNAGPANAPGATVVDTFSATQVSGVTWSCAPTGGATCTANGTGNINDAIDIPVGGTLTYTAVVSISSASTGSLDNTATVNAPVGYTETAPGNNSALDSDTPVIGADLQITKTDGVTTYTRTTPLTYTITVTNAGPSNVIGATVLDNFPAQITTTSWSCTASVGATCTAIGGGTISDTVNIPVGGTLTYTVTANISATATGDLINTATVTAPVGIVDPVPGNNSATDTDSPYIDLQITKTDGSNTFPVGGSVTYTVTVTNNSTFDLAGITVSDPYPSTLVAAWGWCVAPCAPAATTTANLSDTINLTAGSSISYSILANMKPYMLGTLTNTATVTVPAGYVDAVPANNSATDSDASEPAAGLPDGSVYPIGDGGSVMFNLTQPIVADGLPTADFAYYELGVGTDIFLDQIRIDISMDGVTWFPVFYWGDGTADTNTNVSGFCVGTEADNCQIPQASLFNNTGITVDVDNSYLGPVPTGNYYWIRFTEPSLPSSSLDGAHVDAIQVLH